MTDRLQRPVSYGRFAQYVALSGPQRVGLARQLVTQLTTPYNPRTDHYRALRRAAIDGTVTGHLTERLALAVSNAAGTRAVSYPTLAENYQRWHVALGLADATIHRPATRTWPDTNAIRINPPLAAQLRDGRRILITVYWKAAALPDQAVTAMLRLAQLANPDEPDLTPVVFDAHRGVHHLPGPPDADYDEWLRSEAASLTTLLDRLTGTG